MYPRSAGGRSQPRPAFRSARERRERAPRYRAQAGALWATQGGSGFRGVRKEAAATAIPGINRDHFPSLPGGGGSAVLEVNRADIPSLTAEGAGIGRLDAASAPKIILGPSLLPAAATAFTDPGLLSWAADAGPTTTGDAESRLGRPRSLGASQEQGSGVMGRRMGVL